MEKGNEAVLLLMLDKKLRQAFFKIPLHPSAEQLVVID